MKNYYEDNKEKLINMAKENNFVLLYRIVYSQNRDTKTYPVVGNHDSSRLASQASAEHIRLWAIMTPMGHGLASQASAEYAQDDETFRAALQNGLLAKS